MENTAYHFAPQELYILFAIGIACYAITVSRHPSSNLGRFAREMINYFLFLSWVPLALHYVVVISGLPPTIFIDFPDALLDPREIHEMSKYAAYYVHIVTVLLFAFWIFFLWKAGGGSSEE